MAQGQKFLPHSIAVASMPVRYAVNDLAGPAISRPVAVQPCSARSVDPGRSFSILTGNAAVTRERNKS